YKPAPARVGAAGGGRVNGVVRAEAPTIRGRFADQVPAREEVLPISIGTLRLARQPAPNPHDCNLLQRSSSPDGDACGSVRSPPACDAFATGPARRAFGAG